MPVNPPILELDKSKLDEFLKRVENNLDPHDFAQLRSIVQALVFMSTLVKKKSHVIAKLLRMMFGAPTETSERILKTNAQESSSQPRNKPKGHGRNGAQRYTGATQKSVGHDTLSHGDHCPHCTKGKLYELPETSPFIHCLAVPFIQAILFELEKLRCNLCGRLFTAQPPPETRNQKYDESVGAMLGVMKYGSGMPFHRMENLQESFGVPLPASTQWEIVAQAAVDLEPAYEELLTRAAQAQILYNDDTTMKILALIKETNPQSPQRKGMFTTATVSQIEDQRIICFFTGPKHAGENLEDLLHMRRPELPPPIQMCDALLRNLPKGLRTIVANCLAHGRRHFVGQISAFPEECRHVIETLASVYHYDSLAKERKLTPEGRLRFHQENSGPLMAELKTWMMAQLNEKKVEPNSGLGKAVQYMLKHWERLTLFLQVPNAPLDNNICERALKLAILNRKNSLFFKTLRGAKVGDMFMTLIYTCKEAGKNPFHYLTALLRHCKNVSQDPGSWMPWNYELTLGTRPP